MQRLETKDSSNIASIAYEESTSTLEVTFKNGGRYAYDNVSKETWDKFNMAESKGSYFAGAIRPFYKSRKL